MSQYTRVCSFMNNIMCSTANKQSDFGLKLHFKNNRYVKMPAFPTVNNILGSFL